MKDGLIESAIFSDASEFTLRTFYLKKNSQLAQFISQKNEGMWVLKNTMCVKDQGITLISDIGEYKKMLL